MYNNFLKRKEKIIITAIDVLDEMGVNGLTTKEIARRQDITEPAIYKQFAGKKEIIMAMLERYASFDEVIKNTMIDNHITGTNGILYFIKTYAEYYHNYPQITAIMFSFDLFKYNDDLYKTMNEIIKEKEKLILTLVTQAVENKELVVEIDRQALTDGLLGAIWSTTFTWKMGGCNFDLKDRIMRVVSILLDGKKIPTTV